MSLKLMYITNRPEVALIAEASGVDRIFLDMEYIGKKERQGGMDTVQCQHTVEDVANIRRTIHKAQLLVRCNPIHDATDEYGSTEEEIDAAVASGADIVMLPYFKTTQEVERFLKAVNGRATTSLLLETPEAVACVDDILALPGIDEIHIGLNDLSLGYHKRFMFELLSDGTVEMLCEKIRAKKIPYGFGGIASLGKGILHSEYIIAEHYRLGSGCAILSRSFCDMNRVDSIDAVRIIFKNGMKSIREYEEICLKKPAPFFEENKRIVKECIDQILAEKTR
jgi:2-keto-3-deoxy-L-rhamnonate aldolase RhmA